MTLTNPLSTPIVSNNIIEAIGLQCYSLTDDFSRYNQVPMAMEDHDKAMFVINFWVIFISGYSIWAKEFSCCLLKDSSERIYGLYI